MASLSIPCSLLTRRFFPDLTDQKQLNSTIPQRGQARYFLRNWLPTNIVGDRITDVFVLCWLLCVG
jgi:hypothetical protein